MFEKGDMILYETIGVCQVIDISKADFLKNDRLYYHLMPKFEANGTISIPVDSSKVMMRGIMSRSEAEDFVMTWPDVECKKYSSDRERPLIYKQIIRSGNSLELAAMIKEISNIEKSRSEKKKILPVREKNGVSTARKLLFGELAAALDISPGDVPGYIHGVTGCIC